MNKDKKIDKDQKEEKIKTVKKKFLFKKKEN